MNEHAGPACALSVLIVGVFAVLLHDKSPPSTPARGPGPSLARTDVETADRPPAADPKVRRTSVETPPPARTAAPLPAPTPTVEIKPAEPIRTPRAGPSPRRAEGRPGRPTRGDPAPIVVDDRRGGGDPGGCRREDLRLARGGRVDLEGEPRPALAPGYAADGRDAAPDPLSAADQPTGGRRWASRASSRARTWPRSSSPRVWSPNRIR